MKRYLTPIMTVLLLAVAAVLAASAAYSAASTTTPLTTPDVSIEPVTAHVFAGGITDIADAGDDRLFATEKTGRIQIIHPDGSVTEFLDISDRISYFGFQQGLLGLVFHANYAGNGYFYVHYTNSAGDSQISRFSVTADPDEAADGAVRLPPLKIAGDQPAEPFQAVDVRFGDLARLSGVAVHTSAVEVSAGDTLTVTLRYDVLAPTDADLTRFVHLYDPAQGMAAQADGIPQQGLNPTWAWLPGEQVGDQVVLTVASDAPPGRYRLVTGFYDAMRGGERVGVFGADGASLPDNLAPLMEIEIHARE